MKRILGKKQYIKNEDWINAIIQIESLVTKAELDKLINETVEEIKQETKGRKSAYAWSGGKDSLVLGGLCRKAGIKECMLGICDLEYPVFMEWIQNNKPDKLEIINTGQNMEWLSKHPEMLFPADSKVAARWFSIVQHKAQVQYYKKHELDMLLLGRRRADGNYCGKGGNMYTDRKGITRYSPLSSWSHETVLSYVHYYNIHLPPIYSWHNGYLCGTHPWPARQWTGGIENAWNEIYTIDSQIVREAAAYIQSAEKYMKCIT